MCWHKYPPYTVELWWLELWWLIHLGWLELSSWSLQVILCIIHPGWLELPLNRTNFHSPKPVRAFEVLLYLVPLPWLSISYLFKSCKEHVAKNLKLCTALGMSTLFANQTGFPWSWDSSAANSSRRDSNISAIRIIILDLSWTGVTDHL